MPERRQAGAAWHLQARANLCGRMTRIHRPDTVNTPCIAEHAQTGRITRHALAAIQATKDEMRLTREGDTQFCAEWPPARSELAP